MFFRWWKQRRRRRLVAQPFPESWHDVLDRNVALYGTLDAAEQRHVQDYLRVFIAEKNWEGCGGLEIDDEIRVTVAAHVGILTLGFPDEFFSHVLSILVYPDTYVTPEQVTESGVVLEGEFPTEGEAWFRGPLILSWADVLAGGRDELEGDNLVLHEFAHQLDMLDGAPADGIPLLPSPAAYERWTQRVQHEWERLIEDCRRHRPTVLDCYGTTDRSEFFAVATEAFFMRGPDLREYHRELYQLLADFYRQDPARRLDPS